MLLELSQDHGGSITFDAIGKMRTLVPAARLYAWRDKADLFSDGRVHAKVAVADGRMCFDHQREPYRARDGQEHGGRATDLQGHIPPTLDEHLRALVSMRIVSPV